MPDTRTDALLAEILLELRALPAAIAAAVREAQAPTALAESERAELTIMVSAIAGFFGDAPFTASDLVSLAGGDALLRGALVGIVGEFDTCTVRRLGKRLARAENQPLRHYRVERVRHDRDGIVWRIVAEVRVSHMQHPG